MLLVAHLMMHFKVNFHHWMLFHVDKDQVKKISWKIGKRYEGKPSIDFAQAGNCAKGS